MNKHVKNRNKEGKFGNQNLRQMISKWVCEGTKRESTQTREDFIGSKKGSA